MAPQYASQQPAGFKNHIEKVAVVGVTGTIGTYITASLLSEGKHKVTAISRAGSSAKIPDGVEVKYVDYEKEETIVDALKGQDALVITMSVTAPKETQEKLIKAAAKAGVPWVLPNEFGYGLKDEGAGKDTLLGPANAAGRTQVEEAGVSSFIAFCNGFWYDFSLGLGAFAIDAKTREATIIDKGDVPIDTTNLATAGLGVARLLALKILPSDEKDASPTLDGYRNGFVKVHSFRVSQRDIFDSVLRVTGTKESEWTVKHEASKERFESARARLFQGDRSAFQPMLYTRHFYPDGSGLFQVRLANEDLGLPVDDLDASTKKGLAEKSATYSH